MAKKKTKLPADLNRRAKNIVDFVTGEDKLPSVQSAAAALGKPEEKEIGLWQ